jgi:uncharacterized Zn finger protein (UPF0148 family)
MACDRCGNVWVSMLPSFSAPVVFCPVCGKAEMLSEPKNSVVEEDLSGAKGEDDDSERD